MSPRRGSCHDDSVDVLASHLIAAGLSAGLAAVGVAPAHRFERAEAEIRRRKSAGMHGGMGFTFRNPARSCDPRANFPDARALVVGAYSYGIAPDPPEHGAGPDAAVARYAQSDHYAQLELRLETIAVELREAGWRAVVVADQNHLVDREAAYQAGIGWYGRSSNLLIPGQGSWHVLGSVVTNAPLPPNAVPVPDGCGSCTQCVDGCPTGAIVGPGIVDARRCLAWLVQAPGPIPIEFRVALGIRLYGCDDCQEVCPPNRRQDRIRSAGFRAGDTAAVPILELLALTDTEILDRHGRWYIAERDPRYLRRNALVALGNANDRAPIVLDVLRKFASGADSLLAEHAQWSLDQLVSPTFSEPTS